MATVLLINDIHLADRPPSSCTDTYLDDLLALLESVVQITEKADIAAVIWAGDVFHSKIPGRTSHATVKRLIDIANRHCCPVLVVAGNHDISHDRLESLPSQPLGVMLASGAVTMLHGWITASDLPIFGVPWLKDFTDETVGPALEDWRTRLAPDGPPGLVVTHAPLYPPGQELPYEYYPAADWARHMGHHGSVHYGHVHEPHGCYDVDGVTFSNPGALSRGSLHEHNLTRPVSIAAWHSVTGHFTHLQLPHRPAAEVFRLAEVAQTKAATTRLDEFLASVGQTRIDVTSVESVVEHIRTLGVDAEVAELAEELLAQAAPQ